VFAVLACKMMELARDVKFEPKLSYVEYFSNILLVRTLILTASINIGVLHIGS
jgi:hypothetical protein